ncbi:diphthamide biosynthesis protein 2-related domain containing protein [Babesia bovis T2Bo]|uniref:2-(3-amino-3-carboxypropyl)histidine synthase subunit 1 n=1 Tax=Babesia bovis TaxID=5865 RepID=A7ANM5_BABBO|nr:diphthamide biosynthesis protein 2-related domain containing protein [Babesia bovis T2Bo]EDO08159.1 diphthamide biosynthesis protein 2-related domain containing protein [Babesia bovis T2Bo]|eukprot:XP_001611727.1 diphthamide biosynthesis protein 2-related domain containing protein [Babesia bovis T2Bo]
MVTGATMDIVVANRPEGEPSSTEHIKSYIDVVARKALPGNYNFELPKCIERIKNLGARTVALQLPEGLLAWGCELADILKFFCSCLEEVIIMADVTYGACCIDDITAHAIGCDLIINYGHSCLIPVTQVLVPCLYVFVEISFPSDYLADVVTKLFDHDDRLFLMGTIQYSNVLRDAARKIDDSGHFRYRVIVPQVSPLLPGEVLGCTSPMLKHCRFELNGRASTPEKVAGDPVTTCCDSMSDPLDGCTKIVFVADGRFHLESALIHNPGIPAYRFDPFQKTVTEESYDVAALHATRGDTINQARAARSVCIVRSMLGRQGNVNIMRSIVEMLEKRGVKYHLRMLSEITLDKLEALDVDAYIQIGCPRLSIDWGTGFGKPILNPYESFVAFSGEEYRSVYPMDYYSNTGGEWSNYTANRKVAPAVDAKDAIRRRLAERAKAKQLMYSH